MEDVGEESSIRHVESKAREGRRGRCLSCSRPRLVAQEAGTITWYAFRIDQRTFGIFDSFGSDEARQAHLQGAVAAALLGRAEELLDGRPEIRAADILAEKLPA